MRPHQREIVIMVRFIKNKEDLTHEEKVKIAKGAMTGIELQKELMGFDLMDFLGIAQILGVNIYNKIGEERKIRSDFAKIEEEIINKYLELPKSKKNKFLRRVRQISKYNKTHIKKEQNS